MHIPSKPTHQIEILPFLEALKGSDCPNDNYDVDRWLYVPNFYSEFRYILGTKGQKPLICIGINPSTAQPDNLDNTLKSVERIALSNGYDSFIMFNVYSQRATRPDDMEKEFNVKMHSENMQAFEYILKKADTTPDIWAAWGSIIEKRDYLYTCLEDMIEIGKRYNVNWYSVGKMSKAGHPHHPLYLKKDLPLDPFDVTSYCNKFKTK